MPAQPKRIALVPSIGPLGQPRDYLLATAGSAVATGLTLPWQEWLGPVNVAMVDLLAVVMVASRLGRGPAVLASVLCVALFDFFYVPPRLSFTVASYRYIPTFAVMLAVALITSHLTIVLRQRAREADEAARRARAMYALASRLAGALSVEQVCEATQDFTRTMLQADARLMLPAGRVASEKLVPAVPTQKPLEMVLSIALQAAYGNGQAAKAQRVADDDLVHELLPLQGSTRSRGVLILTTNHVQGDKLHAHASLLDALASLVATSLERLHFVNVAHQTQLEMSDERLRGSILSALSHDIRTPLTSLFLLADGLAVMQPPLPQRAAEMAAGLRDQAMRLSRMVSNLLDMARLQSGRMSGQMALRLEWQPIEEVIGASIQLLGHALDDHPVKVHMPPDPPLLAIDAVLMERVFGNLLENASKYSDPGSPIDVYVQAEPPSMLVRIVNRGPGFPPDKLQDVFDVFERGVHESHIPGVGLGLSICRAIVEAHGGRIEARNPAQGGAEVRFTLPLGTPPTIEPEAEPQP